MSFHAPLLSQLENLKNKALCLTTVMSPENANLRATIASDTELMTQLKDALTNDQLTGEQLAELLTDRVLDPALRSAQQQQQSARDALGKSFEEAKTNADRLTNSYVLKPRSKRAQAKIKFDTSILAVTGIVNKLAAVDRRLTRVTDDINTMCYDNDSTSDEDDGAVDSTDPTAGATNALKAQNEAKLLEAHQSKREQLITYEQHLQHQPFRYSGQTLGGWSAMSKHDQQKLSLPKINK